LKELVYFLLLLFKGVVVNVGGFLFKLESLGFKLIYFERKRVKLFFLKNSQLLYLRCSATNVENRWLFGHQSLW